MSHHIWGLSACLSYEFCKLKFLCDSFFEIIAFVKLAYLPKVIIMLDLTVMSFYFYLRNVRDGVSEKVEGFTFDRCMIETEIAFEGISAVFCGLFEISLDYFDKISLVFGLDRLLSYDNFFVLLNVTNKRLWFNGFFQSPILLFFFLLTFQHDSHSLLLLSSLGLFLNALL